MSRPKGRRAARTLKTKRTHDWDNLPSNYEVALFTLAGDMLDEMAPAPSQHMPRTTDVGSGENEDV
jgi:hypothetical protein